MLVRTLSIFPVYVSYKLKSVKKILPSSKCVFCSELWAGEGGMNLFILLCGRQESIKYTGAARCVTVTPHCTHSGPRCAVQSL